MTITIAVMNGKGGVGKTSLVANLAGIAAAEGLSTLAVDLDQQGSLARDLGYMTASDGGSELLRAALFAFPAKPLLNVRPRLDVLPGGPELRRLGDQLLLDALRDGDLALDRAAAALATVTEGYDLVVLDLPPGEAAIQQLALRVADWVVVPTTGDAAAIDGIAMVCQQLAYARTRNPRVDILGVAIMFVSATAYAVLREIQADLADTLGSSVRVFSRPIRTAARAAMDCRGRGLTAAEYAAAAEVADPWWKARRAGTPVDRYASNAAALADDYSALVHELLDAAGLGGHHDRV